MEDNSTKILDIATAQVGYQARGKLNERPGGEYIILRAQDFDSFGHLNLDNARRFDADKDNDPSKYRVFQDDILIQARGQQHHAFHIEQLNADVVASNTFYIIRIKDQSRIIPKFLAWWFNQPIVQKYFEQEQSISTIPFISLSAVLDAPVVIPTLETQKIISKLVTCSQKEFDLFQKLINRKEKFIQAAAMRAVKSSQEVNNGK